ncbi:MAG: N-6 DNA methylase, partial [Rikenellaceae bacterium]
PSKQVQETISILVDYMCFLKNPDQINVSKDLVSNDFVANYFEEIIDGCVYELYFEEHMKEKGLNILETVEQMIKPISQISDTKTKGEAIWDVFNSIKKTDNPIRTRLGLYITRSENILKPIIQK